MEKDNSIIDGAFVWPANQPRISGGDASSSKESSVAPDEKIEDGNMLARLGKNPVLKRTFGFMSIAGFTATILVSWEAIALAFQIPIANGGPAGFVYGFIFVWIGMLAIYASLGELASMAPTAGGQYHWVSMLSPPSCHKYLSYISGWLTVIGWQGGFATACATSAQVVQGLIKLTHPDYDQTRWQQMLLFWAVVAFAVFINVLASTVLPRFEGVILIIHIFGFFAVLLPLVVLGEHQPADRVFNLWLNEGGFKTQGISFLVGLLGDVFLFVGADGAVHMSEEIKNAQVVVPWSILASVTVNGILAFSMLIATLFVATDLKGALGSDTGYAFMEIFKQATGSTAGAAVMASLICAMQMFATVAVLASCSRMSWSFARDRGLPGHKWLEKVNPRTSIPANTIVTSSVISILLSLIILGSSTAFTTITSISFCGLFMSYMTVVALLLWRRLTGAIVDHKSAEGLNSLINTPGHQLVWGPWSMGPILGPIVNMFALAFMAVTLFFMYWPQVVPVTAENMNYSILVTGSVLLFSLFWYAVYARKVYTGPIVENAG